jgi:hypothetical protein
MYEMRPNELFAINGGYSLIGLILMGAILEEERLKSQRSKVEG